MTEIRPEAQLLKGKEIAEGLHVEIQAEVARLIKKYSASPKLVAIQVGDDAGSLQYAGIQAKVAARLGIQHELKTLPGTATEQELLALIATCNQDNTIHGVIVQLPLPQQIQLEVAIQALDPKKDVEGLHPANLGLIVLRKTKIVPCTAHAVLALIDKSGVELFGKEACVVGQSAEVGRPVALLLSEHRVTTTLCHTGTFKRGQLASCVERADIVVAACGQPELISGEWIKPGSVVIDVGTNVVNGKTVGDVKFEEAKKYASFITPVPGGVGPLTTTLLLHNVITAYRWQMGEL